MTFSLTDATQSSMPLTTLVQSFCSTPPCPPQRSIDAPCSYPCHAPLGSTRPLSTSAAVPTFLVADLILVVLLHERSTSPRPPPPPSFLACITGCQNSTT